MKIYGGSHPAKRRLRLKHRQWRACEFMSRQGDKTQAAAFCHRNCRPANTMTIMVIDLNSTSDIYLLTLRTDCVLTLRTDWCAFIPVILPNRRPSRRFYTSSLTYGTVFFGLLDYTHTHTQAF